jgi:hypothetical protein
MISESNNRRFWFFGKNSEKKPHAFRPKLGLQKNLKTARHMSKSPALIIEGYPSG